MNKRLSFPAESRIFMRDSVHQAILQTVGRLPHESGGLLAVDNDGILVDFRFDDAAGYGHGAYRPTPDWAQANVEAWSVAGLHFAGIVHSHPSGHPFPSPKDIDSGERLMAAAKLDWLLLGIVCDGHASFFCLRADCPGKIFLILSDCLQDPS